MKPKTKAFADKLLSDPKISATQAYLETHETTNRPTAGNEAYKMLRKPSVQIYLKKHEDLAKETIVKIMTNGNFKPDTRIKAAQDILDRNLGKATTRSEDTSVNLNLNVQASQELSEAFTDFITGKTLATD
jgi:hypothetical protein